MMMTCVNATLVKCLDSEESWVKKSDAQAR